jgi:4-hydroxy-tetrahydrodipicolinate synthase
MEKFKGIMALTYTALNPDFSLNDKAICREIDWVAEQGATGIWPGGFAGQWPELSEEARRRHLKICVEHAKPNLFTVAGCHATNTLETIRLVNYAEKIGYDWAWISPTIPRKATESEILRHHKMVLENTGLPIAIYDSSPITHYLSPRLISDIVDLSDRIVAMKAIVGDIAHIAGLYNGKIDKKVEILPVETNCLPHLQLGAPGALAGSEWVPLVMALYKAFQEGRMERAWSLQKAVLDQVPLLLPRVASQAMGGSIAHSGIGFIKEKFRLMSGIDLGPPLPPYEPASEQEKAKAKKDVEVIKRLLQG